MTSTNWGRLSPDIAGGSGDIETHGKEAVPAREEAVISRAPEPTRLSLGRVHPENSSNKAPSGNG